MADERDAPVVHVHKQCSLFMYPVTVCSCCGEPVRVRDIRVEVGSQPQDLKGTLLPVEGASDKV